MLREADRLGCEFIATGHYAKLRNENGRMVISRSADAEKDQTYALWSVREEHLRRTMFPLQHYTKTEARQIAEKHGLAVAKKRESYEICFVEDNDYRRFLRDKLNTANVDLPSRGKFVLNDEIVGEHDGVPFYTIGQRKGLGLSIPSHPAPLYVTGLDVINNTVTLGDDEDLFASELTAHSVNFTKYDRLPESGLRAIAKIRYKDDGAIATVVPLGDDRMRVVFDAPRRAITPGQSVALYEGNDLIGGGIIE